MGLNAPPQGLRALHNKSKQLVKVAVSIAPGDILFVSDDLAGQLQTNSASLVAPADVPPAAPATDETADPQPKSRKPKG